MSAPKQAPKTDLHDLKPGSSREDAAKVGGQGDFGVDQGSRVEREYTSANTKRADPGGAQARSFESDGARESGAGGDDAGRGSSSGGDLDTDIVGVGTGGTGVATSGTAYRGSGPDDSDGTSNEMASGGPAEGRNQTGVGQVGGSREVQGSTVLQPSARTVDGTGADIASNDDGNEDDAFHGEVSSAEADGRDQAGL